METNGKPLLTQKITLEVAVRLRVKITASQHEGVWKLTPVWKVSMTADADPQLTFENNNPKSRDVRDFDGQEVTREFLGLKSAKHALAFFQKYLWDENKLRIQWSELQAIQHEFTTALTEPIKREDFKEFLFQPLPVLFLEHHEGLFIKEKDKFLFNTRGIVDCADVISALRATVFLNRGIVLSRGIEWRFCKNPTCDYGLFKPKRANQFYHDAQCTHRAMANKHSEKTRKAKTKRRRK
jgi:hypothetical protein